MFEDEDWVYSPGAYITYPSYEYRPTDRREDVAFQSRAISSRRTAASERRGGHGMVGWNSSLKSPYKPLGTPRFDIAPRPKPLGEDARIQIRHPSRSGKAQQVDRNSDVHKALEPGKEVMGKVAQFAYQYAFVCNSSQYPSAKDSNWKSAQVGEDTLTIAPDDSHARAGTYYIGVYGVKDSRFSICASVRPQPRKMPVVDDTPPNGFGLLRNEIGRARMRTLAAKRGVWLEWVLQEAGERGMSPGSGKGDAQISVMARSASPSRPGTSQLQMQNSQNSGISPSQPLRPLTGGKLAGSVSEGDLRKINSSRFYTRALSSSGVSLARSPDRPNSSTQIPAEDAAPEVVASGSTARLAAVTEQKSAKGLRDEVPLEHRLAGHRSDYARVKRDYNTKLVESLGRMEHERAFNHRLRTGALAQIDPTSAGLQLATVMELMRSDAYSLKMELERLERERARAGREGTLWSEVMGGGSGHTARATLDALTKLRGMRGRSFSIAPRRSEDA
ncbi:hypothetical protein T492DRAFT_963885 [Pavlovales sp. CCMP2436]|nr:hypothetical protein T492DRAFT_963885 [Pavlovales sp. CCMP2436]